MPRITRPQVYRGVREMLLWLVESQLRNEQARHPEPVVVVLNQR